jgi:hypothetical protein
MASKHGLYSYARSYKMNLTTKSVLKIILTIALTVGLCSTAYEHEKRLTGPKTMANDIKVFDLLNTGDVLQGIPNSVLESGTNIVEIAFKNLEKMDVVRNSYEKFKSEKRLDHLVFCIQRKDEKKEILSLGGFVHANFPGIRVAYSGDFPDKETQTCLDIYIPLENKISKAEAEDIARLETLKKCVLAVVYRKHQNRYPMLKEARQFLTTFKGVLIKRDNAIDTLEFQNEQRKRIDTLIARFKPLTVPYEKWDQGAMSFERAEEVRTAMQAARRRKVLFQKHIKACEALSIKPLSQDEWNGLWTKRVLFSQDFEGPQTKEHDWDGDIVINNVYNGSKHALSGKIGQKYFARRTRIGIYYDNARATTQTWVTFKYFINKDQPIGVFVFNMKQADNWTYTIKKPVVGKWTEICLDIMNDFRKKAGGNAKIKAVDSLDDIFIHAGKPGDNDLELIVDDVCLIGRE